MGCLDFFLTFTLHELVLVRIFTARCVCVERVNMTKYPELSRIPWYLAEVNEGDCLYLPYLWIHNVRGGLNNSENEAFSNSIHLSA